MPPLKKLPDAEFDIMKVIWANEPPITTLMIMEQLGKKKGWKAQTILTLLGRLTDREFIKTEKKGKERLFFPLIKKEDYLKLETENFIARFHENSVTSLVAALYNGEKIQEKDIDELEKWLKESRD